eukprot:2116931-Rhodomonas_salina.2
MANHVRSTLPSKYRTPHSGSVGQYPRATSSASSGVNGDMTLVKVSRTCIAIRGISSGHTRRQIPARDPQPLAAEINSRYPLLYRGCGRKPSIRGTWSSTE